jgi:WD40 repeat protein
MERGWEAFALGDFKGASYGVVFSPDGTKLAAIGSGSIKIWNADKADSESRK